MLRFETKDQVGQIVEGKNLLYYTQRGGIFESVYLGLTANLKTEYISDVDDLGFASRDEAIERINLQLDKRFGIKPEEWWAMELYAVKSEGVEQYKQMITQEADESDATDKVREQLDRINSICGEDFYYLKLKFKIDEIPLYTGSTLDGTAPKKHTPKNECPLKTNRDKRT